jgi:lambda family phage portal protein
MKKRATSRHSAARPKAKHRAKRRALPVNRYEAAYQMWGDRSYLPASVQDARFDADASTRLELLRRSRYWERNNAIVNRLADVFEQFTVGADGLKVIPSCPADQGGEDWNQCAGMWWKQWCKFPDVSGLQPFGVLQSIMTRAWFVDGEVFIYKTFSPQSGFPRIQLIEGHRVGTPPHLRSEEGKSIVDGIEFWPDPSGHPTGRPRRYWVRTYDVSFYPSNLFPTVTTGAYEPIDGNRIIHLFEPCRPGMYRGLPLLYPVMNDLHDLDDLQMLEMKAAKAAAEVSNVITNKPGEANTSSSRRQKWQIQGQDAAGNPVNKTAPLFYEVTNGGRTVYMATGEKFEQFQSTRPSVATKDYWDYLVRKICAGVGISSLLVLPFSLQGTVTRADLDTAASFFRSRSAVVAAVIREIYLWAMSWAVKYDRSMDGAPDQWWHMEIRPPRSVTVDVGRNSSALMEELKCGVRNYQDICAEMGHDWRHVLRQKAIEAKFINDLMDEFDVDRDQIAELARETMTKREQLSPSRAEMDALQPDGPNGTEPATTKQPATTTE